MTDMTEFFGEPIFSYSRAQAIEDGVLADVSETAREAGIRFPVAVTSAVWDRYVEFDPSCAGQSEKGRLWDILWMLRDGIRRSRDCVQINYKLYVAMPYKGDFQSNEERPERGTGLSQTTHRLVTLKAVIGPGDTADPVITIMLPSED